MDPYGKIRLATKPGGLKFPSDIDKIPICFQINLREYSALTDYTSTGGNYIYLPMPTNGLVDGYNIQFDNKSMGAIGGVASTIGDVISGKQGIVDSIRGSLRSGLAMGVKAIGGSFAEQLGDEVGKSDVASAATDLTAGFINNPNYSVLFLGVTPRNFKFNWNLIAKNADEAVTIQNIITLLKKSALPSKQFGANFALNYPSVAKLAIIGVGKEQHITFYENGSFISDIQVDYSGSDHASFFKDKNSRPVHVKLSISFHERGIITSDDIIY